MQLSNLSYHLLFNAAVSLLHRYKQRFTLVFGLINGEVSKSAKVSSGVT